MPGFVLEGFALSRPDAAEIALINASHFVRTPLHPCDLVFVFGTRKDSDLRASVAADLWHRGFCKWAIVSGGMTPGADRTECAIIKDEMVRLGVPHELILEEHQATNTGENVTLSLPIIEAALGLASVRSVICLGNSWTARRYPMTLHRHWPDVRKVLVTINPFETTEENWHEDPVFSALVLKEWDKIAPYLALGFIAEWP